MSPVVIALSEVSTDVVSIAAVGEVAFASTGNAGGDLALSQKNTYVQYLKCLKRLPPYSITRSIFS